MCLPLNEVQQRARQSFDALPESQRLEACVDCIAGTLARRMNGELSDAGEAALIHYVLRIGEFPSSFGKNPAINAQLRPLATSTDPRARHVGVLYLIRVWPEEKSLILTFLDDLDYSVQQRVMVYAMGQSDGESILSAFLERRAKAGETSSRIIGAIHQVLRYRSAVRAGAERKSGAR